MMDPISFWMKANVFWIRMYQNQQETCLRMLCSMSRSMPRESAAEIGAEAESLKNTLRPASRSSTQAKRPVPKLAPRVTKASVPV
ncbi:hypothetical protein [Roseinatronobacter alkalisoli]|uniref:Uncharacterized protein n=1 Tax=Roseinatronobacter alkalisoli TaxID=3028235 RepID=A0ABT5T5C4_9RHOB|nr:hypothetical protein [Roseinatronobacter sp. HJB301]MDD7970313.1 hypothetical protein [Roseinatronobacter sp. HJB301]